MFNIITFIASMIFGYQTFSFILPFIENSGINLGDGFFRGFIVLIGGFIIGIIYLVILNILLDLEYIGKSLKLLITSVICSIVVIILDNFVLLRTGAEDSLYKTGSFILVLLIFLISFIVSSYKWNEEYGELSLRFRNIAIFISSIIYGVTFFIPIYILLNPLFENGENFLSNYFSFKYLSDILIIAAFLFLIILSFIVLKISDKKNYSHIFETSDKDNYTGNPFEDSPDFYDFMNSEAKRMTDDLDKKLRREAEEELYRQQAEKEKQKNTENNNFDFFLGCEDLDSLKKRYRDLMKIYHSDGNNGSEEIASKINVLYEEAKKKFT